MSIRKMDMDTPPSPQLQEWMMQVATCVTLAMHAGGISREQLAERSGLPVEYLKKLAGGKISPTFKAREALRKALFDAITETMEKPMQMSTNVEKLRQVAAEENNGVVSAGGLYARVAADGSGAVAEARAARERRSKATERRHRRLDAELQGPESERV